jgi:hypothetical protein
MKLPFGEFKPDQPELVEEGQSWRNSFACNVVPGGGHYLPFYELAPTTDAADSRPLGGASVLDNDGAPFTVVGDAGKLYSVGAGALTDISKTGGYAAETEDGWEFAVLSNVLFATNIEEPLQSIDLTTGTDFDDHIVSTDTPQARYIAVINNFPVLANVKEDTDYFPNRVRWPSINDSTNFDVSVARQADYQDIADAVRRIMALWCVTIRCTAWIMWVIG